MLTDLYARASSEAANWFEALPLDAPALFPVSWAGEDTSAGWFDLGREFTEVWHHQAQIRLAVGADRSPIPGSSPPCSTSRCAACRTPSVTSRRNPGDTVAIDIGGASGGGWTLSREVARWTLWRGEPAAPTARVRLSDETARQLLFNGLKDGAGRAAIHVEGRAALGQAFLRALSVVV